MKKKLIVTVSINEEDYIDLECLVNGIESGYIIKTEKEECPKNRILPTWHNVESAKEIEE